jgi:predicted HicB family RNase H-like nuclease
MSGFMAKQPKVRETIEQVAQSAASWADVSNFLFDPEHGLLVRAYPERKQREKFLKSEEYQKIRATLLAAMQRTGVAAGATPEKSGKFVVRLPKSLHASLEHEAEQEGVSLNQLVVTKLAIPLSEAASAGS